MIQSIRGTKDILPDQISDWHFVESVFRKCSSLYGYKELRTPIFESTDVFSRSIGDTSDIVNKEMYIFKDKGNESLTLRPEQTAALVRAVIQHSLDRQSSLLKLWYFGPYFRYERPQKGRLRQFHQFGAECISSPFPESDVDIILLANSIIHNLGITDYKLLINTLGTENTRLNYKNALIEYLKDHKDNLSFDSQNRLESNPLRVLDSKDAKDQEIINGAPIILDYLDEISKEHFEKVTKLLDSASISYTITPRLVRGLDYYCHTVFEFQSDALGAQDSFGGGGRYDGLFEQLGGKQTPGVGFAMGVERLLLILEALEKTGKAESDCDVFFVVSNPDLYSFAVGLADKIRNQGIKVQIDLNRRSMKSQFKESNRLNANFTVVIGEDEYQRSMVVVKDMNKGEQTEIPINDIEKYFNNIKD